MITCLKLLIELFVYIIKILHSAWQHLLHTNTSEINGENQNQSIPDSQNTQEEDSIKNSAYVKEEEEDQ